MSKQGNLDSFFGVKKENRVQKQAKLSFASKPKTSASNDAKEEEDVVKQEATKQQEENKPEEKNKENTTNHSSQDDLMDTDEEDNNNAAASLPERKRNAESQKSPEKGKRSKRAILEDSDDEEEEFKPNDAAEEEEGEEDEDLADEEPVVKKKESTKKSVNAVLKPKAQPKPSKGAKKSELAAHAMKMDEDLLKSVTWKDHVSYAAVCETFEAIDEISGRLEIQERLTELFRRVLLKNPQDLYQLIYLASNTVAPAYECVELGIGDSILIKAIGEAYGTNPCKYSTME